MALIDGILAYWNLNDNGSGGVSLVDSTGNSYTLTNNNGVTLGTGIIAGDAVVSSQIYSFLNTESFYGSVSDFSVAGWIYVDDSFSSQYPSCFSGSSFTNFNVYVRDEIVPDGLRVTVGGSDTQISGVISVNTWHYIAITRTGSDVNIYVDGYNVGSGTNGDSVDLSGFYLGSSSYGSATNFNGGIDEVGVWSRELSSIEVYDLYNSGYGLTYPFVPPIYYNAAVNNSFGTLGNYWLDSSYTTPATSLPSSSDFVYVNGNASSGSLVCSIATITDSAISGSASITSAVTLNGTSSISSVTITGNAVLNDTSSNSGTITGNATLNGTSTNSGTIGGNATLNGTSTNSGTIGGNTTFNDSSSNEGTINGDATFNDYSSNTGNIGGNADVYHPAENPLGGTVVGTITYYWPSGTGLWGNEVWIDGSPSFIIPAESDVKAGVEYGPAESPYIGTYVGSGGGRTTIDIARLINLPPFIKI